MPLSALRRGLLASSWRLARAKATTTVTATTTATGLSERALCPNYSFRGRFFSTRGEGGEGGDDSSKPTSTENLEMKKLLSELYKDFDEVPQSYSQPSSADEVPGRRMPTGPFSTRVNEYEDEDAEIIYDIDEERAILEERGQLPETVKRNKDEAAMKGLDLEHGAEGVFDVKHLVDLLRRENCADICVISVPQERSYVNQMVIVTCLSARHVSAVAEFVMKVYKKKMHECERSSVPDMEGYKRTGDWIAIDMGNIALHLFTEKTREKYDLESLWTLGADMDDLTQKKDPLEDFLSLAGSIADFKPIQ